MGGITPPSRVDFTPPLQVYPNLFSRGFKWVHKGYIDSAGMEAENETLSVSKNADYSYDGVGTLRLAQGNRKYKPIRIRSETAKRSQGLKTEVRGSASLAVNEARSTARVAA